MAAASPRSPTSSAGSGAEPDAGIWEVRAEPGAVHSVEDDVRGRARPSRRARRQRVSARHERGRWRREAAAIRAFVESAGYSEPKQSYRRAAADDGVDASLLLAVLAGYDRPDAPRLVATVDAVRRVLGHGPFVHRYLADDGVAGEDGAFVACSFWLVEALARQGRRDEAVELMDELVGPRERRRPLRRGDRPGKRRLPRQLPAGVVAPRADQRRGCDRRDGVIWGALVGGLLGTVVLTTVLRAAGELGLTRMDLPFLLGTAFTEDRVRAKLIGYALHFVFGLVFALGYWAVFATLDQSRRSARRAARPRPRTVRRYRARQRHPAGRPPADGHRLRRRRLVPAARAAGIHAGQLRPPDDAGDDRCARRLRRDRRRASGASGLNRGVRVVGKCSEWRSRVAGILRQSYRPAR